LKQNIDSERDEAIALFLEDAKVDSDNGNIVFLAGDFNEPSHLDWGEDTKDLFDHNGVVAPWHNSITLKDNNFLDAYRTVHPDVVKYPGFTWAANNKDASLSHLVWTPDADDRDRVDFVYYHSHNRLEILNAKIVGPVGCIVKGQRVETNPGLDEFLEPNGVWPTDHKGVLVTFSID